ncbi:MAG: hypothetical protein V3U80_09005 [Flavobacteriaceae bacterium]
MKKDIISTKLNITKQQIAIKLKHITYNQIDFKKYDLCLNNAINKRIYALSWYMDIVTQKDWSLLVLGDYKAVLPLPYKRIKRQFFKHMVCQPIFSQQLGVFSINKLSLEELQIFQNEFLKMNVFSYHFNAFYFTELSGIKKCIQKTNYQLDLQASYTTIKSHYSKNLIRNIKKATKVNLIIHHNGSVTDFISLKKKYTKHRIKNKDYQSMKSLTTAIINHNLGSFYTIKKEEETLAMAFFIETENRLVHLISISSPKGKAMAAMPFLFDSIIEKNADKKCIFDFEGSEIPGVAQFFKSFGAVDVPYLSYH